MPRLECVDKVDVSRLLLLIVDGSYHRALLLDLGSLCPAHCCLRFARGFVYRSAALTKYPVPLSRWAPTGSRRLILHNELAAPEEGVFVR